MHNSSLEDIFIKLQLTTTCHMKGTDKYSIHKYVQEFYEKAFKPYQNKPIRLLEIGTCTGASVLVWRHYFPKAEIYAMDNQDWRFTLGHGKYIHDKINYLIKDAYNEDHVKDLGNFDIIIDDGAHTSKTNEKFVDLYFNKLNPGGLLIIEDFDQCGELENRIRHLQTKTTNKVELIDNRSLSGYNNSRLIYVKK